MLSLSRANRLKNKVCLNRGLMIAELPHPRISSAALALALALWTVPLAGTVEATDVGCDIDGDGAGWTIAADADFDGDGVLDLAVGAPCSRVGSDERVGRVVVYSGQTKRRLLVVAGTAAGQKFGGAIAFVGDVSGDGLGDLIVGSPGWNVTVTGGQVRNSAGKIEVFSRYGVVELTKEGTYGAGNFGEAASGVPDLDEDGVADLVVGAGNDRDVPGGDRLGAIYLISGADGAVIDTSLGDLPADQWGAVLSAAGDVDGDGVTDVLASSNAADNLAGSTTEENNGLVRVLAGEDFSRVIAEARGAPEDKLGKSSTMVGDLNTDETPDFAAGAPGVTIGFSGNAGIVELRSGNDGHLVRTLQEPAPQAAANFGSAVAGLGFLNGDSTPDLVASAPFGDVGDFTRAGRVHAFSGKNGAVLWSASGPAPGTRFGHALVNASDWNGDGVSDVAVGSPGDAFRGRRGAGSVRILSGSNGDELARFGGWRGLETRLFVASRGFHGMTEVLSVAGIGRSSRSLGRALRGVESGSLSIAVVDGGATAAPGAMKVAVAGQSVESTPLVEVLPAGRRRGARSGFAVEFSAAFTGDVNVAAGDLLANQPDDEIAISQASGTDGTVEVSVYSRVDIDPFGRITWGRQTTFPVFVANEMIDGFAVTTDGATIAVGAITPLGNGIVAGSASGTPVVRIVDSAGLVVADWLTYPPQTNGGTSVAVANLDAVGNAEIVTVPYTGPLRVRAFNSDGTPFVLTTTAQPVDFVVPAGVVGAANGFRVAVADVDLDDRREVLVFADAPGAQKVFAFELEGTVVSGWPSAEFPFRPLAAWPIAVAATDRFVRR
jgi:hypothetical protein